MKYQFRKGARGVGKLDAQKVGEEIDSLITDESKPLPEDILDFAKNNPDSELHKYFDWEDSSAAKKYRIEQARYIARVIVHVVQRPDTDEHMETAPPEVRVFFEPKPKSGYSRTIEIYRNEDEYASLLEQAMRELRAFKKKYSTLVELEEIFKLID